MTEPEFKTTLPIDTLAKFSAIAAYHEKSRGDVLISWIESEFDRIEKESCNHNS